jgi:hypothetical protein
MHMGSLSENAVAALLRFQVCKPHASVSLVDQFICVKKLRAETVDKAEGTSSLERSSVHVPVPQWCASGSSCRNETDRRRTAYRSQFVSTMVCQKRTGFGNRGVGCTCWLGNKLGERAHPRPRAKQSSVSQVTLGRGTFTRASLVAYGTIGPSSPCDAVGLHVSHIGKGSTRGLQCAHRSLNLFLLGRLQLATGPRVRRLTDVHTV